MIDKAKLLARHLPNILTYFTHRITNAVAKGLNSKIPKFDIRDVPEDSFQLIIHSHAHIKDVGVNVDLNALVEAQLVARTKLVLERL
jgi:hypothetical protein